MNSEYSTREPRALVQALTDRRENGPFADWPLASWSIQQSRDSKILHAELTTTGIAAAETNLFARPAEAAERFWQLVAALWPHLIASELELLGSNCYMFAEYGKVGMYVMDGPWPGDDDWIVRVLLKVDAVADGQAMCDLLTAAARTVLTGTTTAGGQR